MKNTTLILISTVLLGIAAPALRADPFGSTELPPPSLRNIKRFAKRQSKRHPVELAPRYAGIDNVNREIHMAVRPDAEQEVSTTPDEAVAMWSSKFIGYEDFQNLMTDLPHTAKAEDVAENLARLRVGATQGDIGELRANLRHLVENSLRFQGSDGHIDLDRVMRTLAAFEVPISGKMLRAMELVKEDLNPNLVPVPEHVAVPNGDLSR